MPGDQASNIGWCWKVARVSFMWLHTPLIVVAFIRAAHVAAR